MLLFSLLAFVGVVRAENVAKIGDVGYATLQEAINAVQEGETITLVNSFELTAQDAQDLFKLAYNRESYCGIYVPDDKPVTIDLNGCTVSYIDAYGDVDNVMVLNLGNLTINDSKTGGKLTYKAVASSSQYSKFYSTIFNCGTLTVNAGIIENTCETATDVTNAIDNHSRLSHEYDNDCILTVNGGTLTGAAYYSIRQYTHYLEGVQNRVIINGGILNNGIYMQHGESWYYADPDKKRLNVDCGLTINGGTFYTNYEGASCVVSRLVNPDNNAWSIAINDGIFYAPIKLRVQRGVYYENGVSGTTVPTEATGTRNAEWLAKNGGFIKGGTFADAGSTDDVTSNLASFLVAGYQLKETENNTFKVVESPKGTVTPAYTSEATIWGEGGGNAKESFVVKLYSNETLLATSSLNNIGGIIDGDVNVTWNIPLNSESNDEYWDVNWVNNITAETMPTKVVLFIDGEMVAENNFQLNSPDDLNKIYAAVADADGKFVKFYTDFITAASAAISGQSVIVLRNVEVVEGKEITLNGVNVMTADGVTLTNNGTFKVGGEITLNIATLAGKETIDFLDGAIIRNSTVGGEVFVAGNVTFRGTNNFAMLYDYGTLTDYYNTTANMKWTVEKGASVTLTKTARYGLGYGDEVTVYGNIENALAARETLTDADRSLVMHGLVAQESTGWNCNSALTVENAYVSIGSNNSFGNKSGNYGGTYTFNIKNSVVDASRITFYEALSTTAFTFDGSDVKMGTFMTRDADSKFILKNSKVLSTTTINGNDEGNYNAGELTLENSNLTYSAELKHEAGTISLDVKSLLTAPKLSGAGQINVDAKGITEVVKVISADMSDFTGNINVKGANCEVTEEGLIITPKNIVAKIGETEYESFGEAISAAHDATDETTIVLENYITVSEPISITKLVTIDMNGYEISRAEDYEGYVFEVTGSELVLAGEGSIADGAICYIINDADYKKEADKTFALTENKINVDIVYNRTFGHTSWQVLYVPFAIPVENMEGFEVYSISDVTDSGVVIEQVVEGVLAANTPYIIKADIAEELETEERVTKSINVTGTTLYGNPDAYTAKYDNFTINGTYSSMAIDVESQYVLTYGLWCQLTEQAVTDGKNILGAFRVYLTANGENTPSKVRFVINNSDATAIDELKVENGNVKAEVYDLSGRRVEKAEKGIFVVNGKKVVK